MLTKLLYSNIKLQLWSQTMPQYGSNTDVLNGSWLLMFHNIDWRTIEKIKEDA